MRIALFALALLLCAGCATQRSNGAARQMLAHADTSRLPPNQFGYPIFVRDRNGVCTYQIQDMIMRDETQVKDWMKKRPFKGLRVDIVFDVQSPKVCIESAKAWVEQLGYSDVQVREGSEADYDELGPPR